MNVLHSAKSIHHNGNGAVDFVTDLVMHEGNHPRPKYEVNGEVEATGDYACFVVVKSTMVERKYSREANTVVPVYKFVLMDGSGTLFKGVTNSCLSSNLCSFSVKDGSSLIVYDYELVWMQAYREHEFRFVMLINKCTWKNRPEDCQDLGRPVKSIHIDLCLFSVDKVDKESIVVFTMPAVDHPERYVWNHLVSKSVTLGQMETGDWIKEPDTRIEWATFIHPLLACERCVDDDDGTPMADEIWQSESFIAGIKPWNMNGKTFLTTKDCNCVSEFGFCQCVCETFPVDEMNVDDIFTSCVCRLDALRDSNVINWEGLSASHKRWCIYWWYAVNIYGIRSCARPLPICLVHSVRVKYPNPVGVRNYTGYKSTVERAASKRESKRAKNDKENSPSSK
jgi:hypothetical protein